MSQTITTVDARGLSCPLPVVKAAQALKLLGPGETFEVLATDPGSQSDIPAWCRATGTELVEHGEDGGVYRYLLKKKG
ncbi:MAG TPA: sulfurtransferase TusA family protein [Actinomycetota bacterium]|nr:sulfurtransferase TusA family protein [Actinomycetota bacterium]